MVIIGDSIAEITQNSKLKGKGRKGWTKIPLLSPFFKGRHQYCKRSSRRRGLRPSSFLFLLSCQERGI
jgi:hypothetical protein